MKISIIGLWLFCLLTGCSSKEERLFKIEGRAQGTTYHISWVAGNDDNYQEAVDSLLKQFDKSLSTYLPTSLISRINHNDNTALTDPWFKTVFQKAATVSAHTRGAFDCTVAPLVNAWGFGTTRKTNIDTTVIDSLLQLVGYQKVKLLNNVVVKSHPSIQLDFNAIAQGYAVDLLASLLEENGVHNYLVELGGEVKAKGTKLNKETWKVGIDQPIESGEDNRALQAIIQLNNQALATSGNYRKFYEEGGQKFAHILDPRTGYPAKHNLLSATVVASDCITADAYATAFMVMGKDATLNFIAANPSLQLAVFLIYDDEGKWKTYSSASLASATTNLY